MNRIRRPITVSILAAVAAVALVASQPSLIPSGDPIRIGAVIPILLSALAAAGKGGSYGDPPREAFVARDAAA